MKIIRVGNKNVEKIIHQKIFLPNRRYRCSLYVFFYEEKGRYFITHIMTGEILELTKEQWDIFFQLKNNLQNYDFIIENNLVEMFEKCYIVPELYEEAYAYSQVLSLLKSKERSIRGYRTYTILPTTGCNARCTYCYEEGITSHHMTEATADRLVDFICDTKCNGQIQLRWFGGEPLISANIISRICFSLIKRGIRFTSDIITNASLLTKELAYEAKEIWHLNSAQVSLDGERKDYALRKRYVHPEKHNYDKVMNSIQYLANEDIHVTLRVNVDKDNIQRVDNFLNEMGERFGRNRNVSLYLAPIFQELDNDDCESLYNTILSFNDKLYALGLSSYRGKSRLGLNTNYCMASNVKKNIVILPDGSFNHCEHIPEKKCWGNIFDDITDIMLFKELIRPHEIDSECAQCPFLPLCTPFRKHGCPNCSQTCKIGSTKDVKEEIHKAILNEDEKTK